MDNSQTNTMDLVTCLAGRWQGTGVITFPTIQTLDYREEIEFEASENRPLIHFDQRTWKKLPTGEFVPSHRESGFWRVLPNGEIEIDTAESGGRLEVYRGLPEWVEYGFNVYFHNVLVANDPRICSTARQFTCQDGRLQYWMQMRTVDVSELTMHVHADLTKIEQARD